MIAFRIDIGQKTSVAYTTVNLPITVHRQNSNPSPQYHTNLQALKLGTIIQCHVKIHSHKTVCKRFPLANFIPT